MLYNGSTRPGHPGRRKKWLAKVPPKGFHRSPLAKGFLFAWLSHGLCAIFSSILPHFAQMSTGFPQKMQNILLVQIRDDQLIAFVDH